MDPSDLDAIVGRARAVAANAHVPASGFRVGAAVLADDGRLFTGCNVENTSYGLTVCAERNAVFHGVAEGAKGFELCVVVTPMDKPGYPCGACLQVLAEFGENMDVVLVGNTGITRRMRLADLLPFPFEY